MKNTMPDLSAFYGTENYHKNLCGLIYTDGIQYLAKKAGAFWLIDAVESYQPKLRKNEGLKQFQLWQLSVNGTTGKLACLPDSDKTPVITQELTFTDFPEGVFEFYVCDGIMMLKSEY